MWIKSVFSEDKLRIFILLDTFTQFNEEFEMNSEANCLLAEYAQMCKDEIEVYNYMIQNNFISSQFNILDLIVNYYCKSEDFTLAKKQIGIVSNKFNYKDNTKMVYYEKLKENIEERIKNYLESTVIFPEIIIRYLQKKNLCNKAPTINSQVDKENFNSLNIINPNLQFLEVSHLKEIKLTINFLIKKITAIKDFLFKYDEQYKNINDSLKKINTKPFSFLCKHRLKPKINNYLLHKTLSYINLSDFYSISIQSLNSSIVHYALDKIKNFPIKSELIFSADNISCDLVEYMFKVNILAYTKYNRESYSTKICFMKFINNNYHIRSLIISYSVKNLLYLYGVNENYIGLFTPFYLIILDSKSLNFILRYRFEINHYTDDYAVIYLNEYKQNSLGFAIMNVIYILTLDNSNSIGSKLKFEGHKDEITILSYKKIEDLDLLLSSSKSQIVMWDLATQNVYKVFNIDESKLLIKDLILLNFNNLCITTVYNQLYVLKLCETNCIDNVYVINFSEEDKVYDLNLFEKNDEHLNDYLIKLNRKNICLYDPLNEKVIFNYFDSDQNFEEYDLIFICRNRIIKRFAQKNKILVYRIY